MIYKICIWKDYFGYRVKSRLKVGVDISRLIMRFYRTVVSVRDGDSGYDGNGKKW